MTSTAKVGSACGRRRSSLVVLCAVQLHFTSQAAAANGVGDGVQRHTCSRAQSEHEAHVVGTSTCLRLKLPKFAAAHIRTLQADPHTSLTRLPCCSRP